MKSNEILEYRIDQLDKFALQCSTNYSGIYANLKSIEDCLDAMNDKLVALEMDLRERKLKKYIFNTMLMLYPLVITIMIGVQTVDHQNIVTAMDNIEGWLGSTING